MSLDLSHEGSIFKNIESPFTELFSLLKRYENLPESPTLAYSTPELKAINSHVGNVTVTLLQGLQDIGNLIGLVGSKNKKLEAGLCTLGFFIATISNLAEALYILQSDTDYVLWERR
jgi:hypothetical protein